MEKNIEGINPDAIDSMINQTKQKTWDAVRAIRQMLQPGMTEKQAIQKANAYFAQQGVRKFWHQTHIRFGRSTVLGFDDDYLDSVTLKENDIFYIDIGPVWNGIEGDCGDTFVMGHRPECEKIAADVKVLFHDVQDHWRRTKVTGVQLYAFAEQQTTKMGYKMHPSYVKGHRLSEFSHALYTKIGMFDLEFSPASERWVLELQICHPSMAFGAFYEDLLMDGH